MMENGQNMSNRVHKDGEIELPKRLAAFDFDQTVVVENTDYVARDLIDGSKIGSDVQKLVASKGWTAYMQEVFGLLHENKITPDQIRKAIGEMDEIPGMVKCFQVLHEMNFDLIIISDANSEFINTWNEKHGLNKIVSQVFTNPAKFDNTGRLNVQPYDHQTECEISAVNICKAKVMDQFLNDRKILDNVEYKNIFYVGDGTNDICPVLRLSSTDYGCPRAGFSMDKKIHQVAAKYNKRINAQLLNWKNGFELLSNISKLIKE